MKKIALLTSIIISTLLMTSCYTNVIELNDNGGGNNGGGGGNIEKDTDLIIDDRAQLEQSIFAENQICEVKFTSRNGWQLQFEDYDIEKWITVSESYSDVGGTFTLSIIVSENATGLDRTAAILLISNDENERIYIHQRPEYKDGTRPEPYEKDLFTDVVERIVIQLYLNGDPEPQISEWRFFFNPEDGVVEAAELFQKTNIERVIEQIIVTRDSEIHHQFFNRSPSGIDITVFSRNSEIVRNDYGFITNQKIREYDYRNDNNPEPRPLQERNYQYSNYRRVSAIGGDIGSSKYRWIDGNMVKREIEDKSSFIEYTYDTQYNDRTNIDLNTLLVGDMYAAIGLFGKRSRNLLISTSDGHGGVVSFNYSLDRGRVHTITTRHSIDDAPQPTTTVYTIYYANDNIIDGSK